MEPTASDPDVQQQYGMTVGTPDSEPDQRARHAQPARRALGDLQGRSRPAPSAGCAAGRVAGRLRGVPQAAGRARARGRARRAVRTHAGPRGRCRCTASRSRSRIRSTRWTCGRRRRPTRATTSTFPARDHTLVAQLRQKGAIIYAKAVNTEYNGIPGDPGGRHEPDADPRVRPRATSAAAGPATRTAPTTRRAPRRSARARARARR